MIDTKKSGFCASFSPVKLTYEPSNLLTTTETAELEFLSLYLISKKLHMTLSLSHLLLCTSGLLLDVLLFLQLFCTCVSM